MAYILQYAVDNHRQLIIDTDRFPHRVFIAKNLIGKRLGDHSIVPGSKGLVSVSSYQREIEKVEKGRIDKHQAGIQLMLSALNRQVECPGQHMATLLNLRITFFQAISYLVGRTRRLAIRQRIDTVSLLMKTVGR